LFFANARAKTKTATQSTVEKNLLPLQSFS